MSQLILASLFWKHYKSNSEAVYMFAGIELKSMMLLKNHPSCFFFISMNHWKKDNCCFSNKIS